MNIDLKKKKEIKTQVGFEQVFDWNKVLITEKEGKEKKYCNVFSFLPGQNLWLHLKIIQRKTKNTSCFLVLFCLLKERRERHRQAHMFLGIPVFSIIEKQSGHSGAF